LTNHFNILFAGDLEEALISKQDLLDNHNEVNIFTELDPEKGLDVMLQNNIDLLLVDINMSNINGFEFVEFLKESTSLKQFSTIFIAEQANIKDELNAYKLGAIDYIHKITIDKNITNVKLNNHVAILKKRKQDMIIIKKNKDFILTQTRMIAIAEIVKNTIHIATKSLNLISMMTNSIQYKISSDNLNMNFLCKKLDRVESYAYALSKNIEDISKIFNCMEKKQNSLLSEIMNQALSVLSPIIDFKEIEVRTHYKESQGIDTYKSDILLVLTHILNNSIHSLIKNNTPNPKITIDIDEYENSKIILIEDNAGSTDKDTKNKIKTHILEPEDKVNTRIDLYISEVILNNYCKGSISIESIKSGTSFKLELKNV